MSDTDKLKKGLIDLREELVKASDIPFGIVHATQFF